MDKKLYLIAGPNGAGKTTASKSLLPGLLDCTEFVNADEIARGLSPFHPEEMAYQAARIQLLRINELLYQGRTFAIETTLATRTYIKLIRHAQSLGYKVCLAFFWLPTSDMAKERVKKRVAEGGHDIPEPVIERRFTAGWDNLVNIYIPIVDEWMLFNNISLPGKIIAQKNGTNEVYDRERFEEIIRFTRK